ncbi:MAG: shikimate dehydrogenase [Pseudomonadota bacterium]
MNITAKTPVLAVIGDPVGHSLSPVMHNGWIDDFGLDAAYVALRVDVREQALGFEGLRALRLFGANVTVPHKQAACLISNRLDPAASALRAVNVLRWERDGSVSGFNTDAFGLIAALDESQSGWRSKTGTALVLGAGGAARAAAWGLAQAGVRRVLITNRTPERANEAAEVSKRCYAFPWEDMGNLFESADLIVNATTLGMAGAPPFDWPIERAPDHCIVLDAVYAPLETGLLRAARARGMTAVDGLGMLIHQGALSFEIWFGLQPDIRLARARIMRVIAEREEEPA